MPENTMVGGVALSGDDKSSASSGGDLGGNSIVNAVDNSGRVNAGGSAEPVVKNCNWRSTRWDSGTSKPEERYSSISPMFLNALELEKMFDAELAAFNAALLNASNDAVINVPDDAATNASNNATIELRRRGEANRIKRQHLHLIQQNFSEFLFRPTGQLRTKKMKNPVKKLNDMAVKLSADDCDPTQPIGRKVIIEVIKLKEDEEKIVVDSKSSNVRKSYLESEESDAESD
ncbi:uncharacterized protein LOC119681811 [Teleopsis dalmanni]|uniref:uncharacterized protein LOC119681811 n=1 Tax=Teleopsis dalmanni TaxID=139649 RepID=UPI0018CFDA7A|nr:uncharacterized protein LOC119681811 [Teleopsis dalmanni]XP_037951027.1 uncharacterized protein LOC119681811 [Teleopsis dalmanni]